jgi:hypothetical protein
MIARKLPKVRRIKPFPRWATRAEYMAHEIFGPALSKSFALVEATHNEVYHCWDDYNRHEKSEGNYSDANWHQQGGPLLQIGTFGGATVAIVLDFVTIERQLVCFWHASSEVVHHGLINDFFEMVLGPGYRRSDATNWYHIVHDIRDANEQPVAA